MFLAHAIGSSHFCSIDNFNASKLECLWGLWLAASILECVVFILSKRSIQSNYSSVLKARMKEIDDKKTLTSKSFLSSLPSSALNIDYTSKNETYEIGRKLFIFQLKQLFYSSQWVLSTWLSVTESVKLAKNNVHFKCVSHSSDYFSIDFVHFVANISQLAGGKWLFRGEK